MRYALHLTYRLTTPSRTHSKFLPLSVVAQCQSNFPFMSKPHSLPYLGVHIPSNLEDLYPSDFPPLLNNIRQDLDTWRSLNILWFGRAAVLKKNILPKILYLLQAIPICLPKVFFVSVIRMLSTFLWKDKSPRISLTRLCLPKQKGELVSLRFYRATHLTRLLDWSLHADLKGWVNLEQSVAKVLLEMMPWIS